jgi:hypothetical protein
MPTQLIGQMEMWKCLTAGPASVATNVDVFGPASVATIYMFPISVYA